jgi:hypothetical protein
VLVLRVRAEMYGGGGRHAAVLGAGP